MIPSQNAHLQFLLEQNLSEIDLWAVELDLDPTRAKDHTHSVTEALMIHTLPHLPILLKSLAKQVAVLILQIPTIVIPKVKP